MVQVSFEVRKGLRGSSKARERTISTIQMQAHPPTPLACHRRGTIQRNNPRKPTDPPLAGRRMDTTNYLLCQPGASPNVLQNLLVLSFLSEVSTLQRPSAASRRLRMTSGGS